VGAQEGLKSHRVVFDTNVVVSALLFSAGRLAWLRDAWRDGRAVPLASRATTQELIRVLSYPKFRLSAEDQHNLLAAFLPFAETVVAPKGGRLPACRDPADLPFLALAAAAGADALVTGDDDLLVLRGRFRITIMTPEEFRARLGA
jgi:putative PIN family toxin of toxin-antitoxin system